MQLFLHRKILPTEKRAQKGTFWKNGVELDKQGTSFRWRHSCIKQENPSRDFETETVRVYCRCIREQCRYVVRNKCKRNSENVKDGFGLKWKQVTEGSFRLYKTGNYPKCDVSSTGNTIEMFNDAQHLELATQAEFDEKVTPAVSESTQYMSLWMSPTSPPGTVPEWYLDPNYFNSHKWAMCENHGLCLAKLRAQIYDDDYLPFSFSEGVDSGCFNLAQLNHCSNVKVESVNFFLF